MDLVGARNYDCVALRGVGWALVGSGPAVWDGGIGGVEGVMWHVGIGEVVPCTHCGSTCRETCCDC